MPYRDLFGKGEYNKKAKNCMEIYNGEKTDAVVFIETLDGRKIRHAYIRKNEKYEMKHIPSGKYIVKIMYGDSWNSQKDKQGSPLGGFMKNVSFAKTAKQYTIESSFYSSGKYYYSIILDIERNNKDIESISEGEFF